MEQGKGKHNDLKRSCSFDSFFQCRTQDNQCNGSNVKLQNIDVCNREQHAAVKRTLPFPSMGTNELGCEIKAINSIENSTEMSICSEEDVLNCTFKSCDTEGKGEVYVSRIISYLEDVTGQSCKKGQLRMLHQMFNPEERDIAVNLGTFHNVMKQWIAECREEGLSGGKNEEAKSRDSLCILHTDKKFDASSGQLEGYGGDVNKGSLEATELINDIECLEYTNKKLMDQNDKLQRAVEACEEANVRLTEEVFELKNKLKSSQQVTLHVKLLEDELEDLKSIMKNLEDRNYKMQSQNRQLEKEHQNLSLSISLLQEENGKLTVERDNAYWKNEELLFEMVELKDEIHEAKRHISVKDTLLSEKINQTEKMKSTMDEYNCIIQDLKEEINKLQCHHTCEDLSIPCDTQERELESPIAPVRVAENSLQLEIEEIQQQRSDVASHNLPTPLCGMLPLHDPIMLIKDMHRRYSQLDWINCWAITEELLVLQDIEEETKEFLKKISILFYAKMIWDQYRGHLVPQLTAVIREKDSCTRNGVIKDDEYPAAEHVEPHLGYKGGERKIVPAAVRLEFGKSPRHYAHQVDESSQEEYNRRHASISEAMQVQRTCLGLNDERGHQRRTIELLDDELCSNKQKDEGNNYIRWNMMHSELVPAADGQYEDQSGLSIWFGSQIKNVCLVGFLLVFTGILVAFSSIFSFVPWSCQRYSFGECTDSSFWSLLKALLCPQIRLRHGAPPPV
ncbi:paramyosin-like [Narcine bancroftii]|uniref:paramyosin-like n=1 Tax=Narcine bancroftii TaxID=1343680 RepID=UPI003831438D